MLSYLSALAAREAKTGLRSSSARHRRRSRPCICDQACCPLTLSVEKPLFGKASAALPRDGRESRRRDGRPSAWPQMSVRLRRRCHGEDAQLSCASGSSGQRGTTARCLMWPGWLNDVRCWARAQRRGGVQRAAPALSRFFLRRRLQDVCRNRAVTQVYMPASAELNEFNEGRIILLKGLGSQRERSFAGYDPRILLCFWAAPGPRGLSSTVLPLTP